MIEMFISQPEWIIVIEVGILAYGFVQLAASVRIWFDRYYWR